MYEFKTLLIQCHVVQLVFQWVALLLVWVLYFVKSVSTFKLSNWPRSWTWVCPCWMDNLHWYGSFLHPLRYCIRPFFIDMDSVGCCLIQCPPVWVNVGVNPWMINDGLLGSSLWNRTPFFSSLFTLMHRDLLPPVLAALHVSSVFLNFLSSLLCWGSQATWACVPLFPAHLIQEPIH